LLPRLLREKRQALREGHRTPDGPNRYAYAPSNPALWNDPIGLAPNLKKLGDALGRAWGRLSRNWDTFLRRGLRKFQGRAQAHAREWNEALDGVRSVTIEELEGKVADGLIGDAKAVGVGLLKDLLNLGAVAKAIFGWIPGFGGLIDFLGLNEPPPSMAEIRQQEEVARSPNADPGKPKPGLLNGGFDPGDWRPQIDGNFDPFELKVPEIVLGFVISDMISAGIRVDTSGLGHGGGLRGADLDVRVRLIGFGRNGHLELGLRTPLPGFGNRPPEERDAGNSVMITGGFDF
jgi:hypothetical protein